MGMDDWFGEEDLVNNCCRSYTVICEQNGELMLIRKNIFFQRIFCEEPGKKNILSRMAQKEEELQKSVTAVKQSFKMYGEFLAENRFHKNLVKKFE